MARERNIRIWAMTLLLLFAAAIPAYAQEMDGETVQTAEPLTQADMEIREIPPERIAVELTDESGTAAIVSDGVAIWQNTISVVPLPTQVQSGPQRTDIPRIANDIPCYYQTNYPNTRYGNGTIATSGCSITCLAMVATYMTDHIYSPVELAEYFGGRAYSNMARLETGSDMLQLSWRKANNWHDSLKALQEGKVVIALMEEASLFTASQHFIVLAGITGEGRILVNDPYRPNYDRWELQNGFANGFEESDILRGYSGGWIYDKSAMPATPFVYHEEKPIRQNRYPDISLTPEETELLARVVWVEARGESPAGQQAVAEVVFNRMASSRFADSLQGVIYGEGQFRSVPFLEDATPWQAQYDAIERALYGPYVLPTDVMYFATQPTNDHVWGKIGGHVFCYQEETV